MVSDERDEGGEPACYAPQFEELLFGDRPSDDEGDEPEVTADSGA